MKVLLTDLDGTFFVDDTVSPSAAEALAKWREAGNLVMPVTARPPREVESVASRMKLAAAAGVFANGAYVTDGIEVIHRRTFPDGVIPLVNFLQDVLQRDGRMLSIESDDSGLAYPRNVFPIWHYADLPVISTAPQLPASAVLYACFSSRLDSDEWISTNITEPLRNGAVPGLEAQQAGAWVDIVANGVNKGVGTAILRAGRPDLRRAIWIGMGDSGNDIPLFGEVDIAIAVNAQSSSVIDAADYAVASFSEGIALARTFE